MQRVKNPLEAHFERFTKYHYFLFFLLFLSKVPIFWHVLSLIFLSPPMVYTCGTDKTLNKCPCDNPVWKTDVFTKTVQTKYKIICDQEWLVSFSQSMFYVGSLFGALTFGFLSDKYGRLPVFCTTFFLLALSGCLVTVMPNIIFFIIMRSFEGMGFGGSIVVGYVFCIEYCGVENRELINGLYHIPINIGHMSLPGISYLLRDCDDLQLALSIPIFFFVPMKWVLQESPKWLMDNGKTERAVEVMEKIAKFNKKPIGNIKQEIEAYGGKMTTKASFFQIFRHKMLRTNFFCLSCIYFVCGMGYYGVSQYIGKMSGDIHLNVAISGALLIPGTIVAMILLKKLGRRQFLMGTLFLSGFFMIIVICIPPHLSNLRVAAACFCNCCFFISFIIVFLYGVELFPTCVRNSVMGVLSMLSRLGQITAPPINSLPNSVSGSIFGVLAIISAILCYPLPDTKHLELPSSLEDSKSLPRGS